MPCYDPRSSDPSTIRAEARAGFAEEFRHNSPVAEMLCAVMKILHPDDRPRVAARVPGLALWWQEHQARDKAKEDAEKEILGYYADGRPIHPISPGFMATACVLSCSKCGHMIRGMGGPAGGALCLTCHKEKPSE